MSSKLNNYLRTYRKRAGLSQQDVSFLLGCQFHTTASRYECFTREPGLRTALALAAILQTQMSDLFAGLFEQAEHDIAERARILLRQSTEQDTNARRRAALTAIAEPEEDLRWEPISPL